MKIKYYSFAMLAAMFATSCSNEEVVETNADPIGEAIDFRPSVGTTRATPMTIGYLGDFNVYAKGIHTNSGSLFSPFLVGHNDDSKAPAVARKSKETGNTNKWVLDDNVYWPSDVDQALFWAFTDRNTNDNPSKTNGICVDGKVRFDDFTGPAIDNYTPVKADLSQAVTNDQGWYDGDNQRDLVSAFRQQTKNPHVSLDFHHLLSQIEITARSKRQSDDKNNSRNVKIKGAWLVNIAPKGNLTAGFKYDKETKTASDNLSWDAVKTQLESYGTVYVENREVPVDVSGSTTNPLNVLGISGRGNLMLVPQLMDTWDGLEETTSGTYLLLLCRVELQHTGTVAVEPGEPIYQPNDESGYHYHQLFPIMNHYDANAYGLSAIAIPVNWGIGKKYTYSLDICGDNTGAGKYPPNIPTDADELNKYLAKFIPSSIKDKITIVTERPAGKNVGDYVLDEPIQFNVSVSNWDDGGEWVNGSDKPAATGE